MEDQDLLAESSSAVPASLWNEAVGTAGENPPPSPGHGLCLGIHLLLGNLNWEAGGSSVGLATVSCEFVQPFAIQVCTGVHDQSLEVGKWGGLSHRAKSASKPSPLQWFGDEDSESC